MIPTLKPSPIASVTFAQSLREVVEKALSKDSEGAVGITGLSNTSVTTGTIEAILRGGPGHYEADSERVATPRGPSYADLYEVHDEAPHEGISPGPASAPDQRERAELSVLTAANLSGGTGENETPVSVRNAPEPESAPNQRPDGPQTAIALGNPAAAATLLQREQGAVMTLSNPATRATRARAKHCRRCGRVRLRLSCDCDAR